MPVRKICMFKNKRRNIVFSETFFGDHIIIYCTSMGRQKYNLSGDVSYEIKY